MFIWKIMQYFENINSKYILYTYSHLSNVFSIYLLINLCQFMYIYIVKLILFFNLPSFVVIYI